jgi:imidazolonepropionase-like amidohydrolase
VGTLRPGLLADVIAVTGDPLADIARLGDPANVRLVAKGGAIAREELGVPAIAAASS